MAGISVLVLPAVAALLGRWIYKALLQPPPPRICGFPVTSPRVKLRDGRHLAYRERGVPRANARHRVVVVHGFDSSKDFCLNASQVLCGLPSTTSCNQSSSSRVPRSRNPHSFLGSL